VRPEQKIETGRIHPGSPRDNDKRSYDVAMAALAGALEKKALEPVLLDVRELASYTDYILVLSGRSDRQVASISDGVLEALAREGVRPIGTEGQKGGQWTLLDFGDLIVHVFHHPVRELYDLESFWVDAPRVALNVPPEARIAAEEAYH
jgi:ribosome-associated protein